MARQVDQRFLDAIDWVEETLAKAEFVEWDRHITMENPWLNGGNQFVIEVYGWIERGDDYKDFVTVRFHPDADERWFEYTTSSAEHTDELAQIWFDVPEEDEDHDPCKRVENVMDIDNMVTL